MVSGAGHDAGVMAAMAPTAMLFVRSPGGVSHHPDEAVTQDDVAAALRALVEFVVRRRESEGACESFRHNSQPRRGGSCFDHAGHARVGAAAGVARRDGGGAHFAGSWGRGSRRRPL